MKVKDLIEGLGYRIEKGTPEREVTGLCFDSRAVSEGDAFVCIIGERFDAHDVIGEIDKKDPAVIIVDRSRLPKIDLDALGSCIVSVENCRAAKASVAAAFYGHPADKLKMIGVTGTKGKTTTTHMLFSILREAGLGVGTIGSNGAIIGDEKYELANTTPDSEILQKHLARMVEKGFEYAIVEVSSQAVKLDRVAGIDFDIGIWLNIEKGDHVGPGEHESFEEYMECKAGLLRMSRTAVGNSDDEIVSRYLAELRKDPGKKVISFGHAGAGEGHVAIKNEKVTSAAGDLGVDFELEGEMFGHSAASYRVGMPGLFNAMNAAAAVICAKELGVPDECIGSALANIRIAGRIDMIYRSPELSVCIDSAHSGMSVRNLIAALREYEPKRLVIVFGAGGNRDLNRRYDMGFEAGRGADLSVVTTEHNRFEPFKTIYAGIRKGMDDAGGKHILIEDRKEAIRHAIVDSEPGDLVAIIGLGEDHYQHILGKNIPHNDAECAMEAVREWEKEHR